jgi:hypothetical protein
MYREEGFAPGRQDLLNANNPVFRSAALIVAPLTFCVCDIRCATPSHTGFVEVRVALHEEEIAIDAPNRNRQPAFGLPPPTAVSTSAAFIF